MQYLFYILAIPFLYFNYKIIVSDLKRKIIPNKYLGYLLLLIPFYYIYIYFSFPDINYLLFIGQIILTFIISFILYYFGIWAAGDAKYLLVLSLFIPNIGIISFIGNISIITIAYLILYFLWFYFGKCIFYKGYAKSLYYNIKTDLSEKWNSYKKNTGGKTIFIILKWIVIFLIIFISIRLSRIYLFNSIIENGNNINYLSQFIEKYNIYLIFGLIILFIGGLYFFRILFNKIKNFIGRKLGLNINLIGNIFIIILFILLSSFIIFEYINSPDEISNLLFLIFTLYISIYIIFKILIYSYKITFGVAEMEYIDIKNLKEGDIVDKEYLVKLFGKQDILGAKGSEQNKKGIFYPDPTVKIKELNKTVEKSDIIKIKQAYLDVNKDHKIKGGFTKINTIKILNTFSFGIYIFIGLVITFIYSDRIIIQILSYILNFYKRLVN